MLFVGFQASGPLGRTILDGVPRVRISGRDVAVRAQIRCLDSYSAHADQVDILRWINERRPIEGSIFLTHGEAGAMENLRRLRQSDDTAASIVTPEPDERYALPARAKARREASERMRTVLQSYKANRMNRKNSGNS